MMGKNLSVTNRVRLAVALPTVALILVVLGLFPVLQSLRIGGPAYQQIGALHTVESSVASEQSAVAALVADANDAFTTEFGSDPADPAVVAKKQAIRTAYVDTKKSLGSVREQLSVAKAGETSLRSLVSTVVATGKAVEDEIDTALLPNLKADGAAAARTSVGAVNELSRKHTKATEALHSAVRTELQAKESAAKSSSLRRLFGLFGLSFLAIGGAVLASRAVVRSVLHPVEALTRQATHAAHEEIPALIASVDSLPTGAPVPVATRFPSDGNDEFSQLGSALNAMQDTAVSMSINEARSRRGIAESLINLGRRNQGLLARTLAYISELEQNERNPETLSHLFRLDHLTTRMRRNAESLLVLAGSEPPRVWTESVPVSDILRAALSEIESYSRVDVSGMEPAKIKGTTVSDLAHLLAELMENATNFSPPSTRVRVLGRATSDGYVVSISDDGIGMTIEEIDEANRRLADSLTGDVTPSKVLGHYVVSKLAARHGIRVWLSSTPGSSGITTDVLLPTTIAEIGGQVAPTRAAPPQPVPVHSAVPFATAPPPQPAPVYQAAPVQPQPAPVYQAAPVQPQPSPLYQAPPVQPQPAPVYQAAAAQPVTVYPQASPPSPVIPMSLAAPAPQAAAVSAQPVALLQPVSSPQQFQSVPQHQASYVQPAPADLPQRTPRSTQSGVMAPPPPPPAPPSHDVTPDGLVMRTRRAEGELAPTLSAALPPVPPVAPLSDPMAEAAALQAEQVLAVQAAHARQAARAAAEQAAAAAPLPTRTRGATWVDESVVADLEPDFRDPAQVRSALSGFQSNPAIPVARADWSAQPDASPHDPSSASPYSTDNRKDH